MSETPQHKSHATGWIIAVVLALVLYVGSAYPVELYVRMHVDPHRPARWGRAVFSFYKPAVLLLDLPKLKPWSDKWAYFWYETIIGPWPPL